MDKMSKKQRSKLMSKIRSKDTKIELLAKAMLEPLGFIYQPRKSDIAIGYEKYYKPDFAHPEFKIVVFIDGCFWHCCPLHFKMPKSNVKYWKRKARRNMARDMLANEYWESHGWKVVRIWEHSLKIVGGNA